MKVKAGTGYNIKAYAPGKGPLTSLGSANFTVSGGGTVTRNLTLAGTGTIQVTISGVTDAFVDARDASGQGLGTSSNINGIYTLTLPASASGESYTVKAGTPKHGIIGSQQVVLILGQTKAISFNAESLFTVSGTVSSSAAA